MTSNDLTQEEMLLIDLHRKGLSLLGELPREGLWVFSLHNGRIATTPARALVNPARWSGSRIIDKKQEICKSD